MKALRHDSALLSVLFILTGAFGQSPVYHYTTLHIDPSSILDTLLAPVVDAGARKGVVRKYPKVVFAG